MKCLSTTNTSRNEKHSQFALGDGDIIHIIIPIAGGASSPKLPPEVAATIEQQPEGGAPGKNLFPIENVLPKSFYARSALEVAPDLLGCLVVREWQGKRLVGRIVEDRGLSGAGGRCFSCFPGPHAPQSGDVRAGGHRLRLPDLWRASLPERGDWGRGGWSGRADSGVGAVGRSGCDATAAGQGRYAGSHQRAG